MLVQVNLYGNSIGTVDWDVVNGNSVFEYTENSYTNQLEPSPILMPKEGENLCKL